MFVLCFLVTEALSKHIDHRNLFTQRVCCKRQSHFVYIGQGKGPRCTECIEWPVNPPVHAGTHHCAHLQSSNIQIQKKISWVKTFKNKNNSLAVWHQTGLCLCLSLCTDISGSRVSVDVGMCRSHCGGASRPSHEAGQQEYPKHSSMLEFLRSKKVRFSTRPQGRAVS